MDDDKEKIVEKYGSWAQFMTESEAKSMLRDYGKVMEIMKGVLEVAFGEGHSYSIDDGQANDGGGLTISGDLDGVASYVATLRNDSTDIVFFFSFFVLPKNIFTNPTQNLSFSLKPAFESSASHVPPTTRLRFINNSDLFLEG